jgi:hypothetical protein
MIRGYTPCLTIDKKQLDKMQIIWYNLSAKNFKVSKQFKLVKSLSINNKKEKYEKTCYRGYLAYSD